MPYYPIDWSRYANHVEVRTPPDAAGVVQEILLWTLRFVKLSGFWISYHLPSKHGWMWSIHVGTLLTLCTAFLLVALISMRFLRLSFDARNVQLITVFVYLVQCTASGFGLVLWQWRKTFKTFTKRLQSCTLGVGMMKQKGNLLKINYVVLALCGVWPVAWATYLTLHVFVHQFPMPRPWNGTILWVDDLNPMTYICLIYMSVCWWLAHSLLIMYYIFSLTELHVLNKDLQADENLYQVPVVKHYIAIHYRLVHLYQHVNTAFRPLVVVSTCGNCTLLFFHVHSFFTYQLNFDDKLFSAISLAFVITYSAAILILAIAHERVVSAIILRMCYKWVHCKINRFNLNFKLYL